MDSGSDGGIRRGARRRDCSRAARGQRPRPGLESLQPLLRGARGRRHRVGARDCGGGFRPLQGAGRWPCARPRRRGARPRTARDGSRGAGCRVTHHEGGRGRAAADRRRLASPVPRAADALFSGRGQTRGSRARGCGSPGVRRERGPADGGCDGRPCSGCSGTRRRRPGQRRRARASCCGRSRRNRQCF